MQKKTNIENIRIAILIRQKILSNSTAIANPEIKHVLAKIKEIARTQTQYEKFSIEEIESSNKSIIEISIQNYAQIMPRNIVNFAMKGISRYKKSSISIISFLQHIQSIDD
jgi:hypothetical protein